MIVRDEREETHLIRCAQAGDQWAFASLIEQYQHSVGTFLFHLVADREVALDLTQETFIRAYQTIQETRPGLLIRPWLYRIALNLARDHFRRTRRFIWLPLNVLDQMNGDSDVESVAERDLVQRTLAQLKPEERIVLLLCGLEQFSYPEASIVVGGSAEAVRKRFVRAKARFRQFYTEITALAPS